jgi:hypothetical protein
VRFSWSTATPLLEKAVRVRWYDDAVRRLTRKRSAEAKSAAQEPISISFLLPKNCTDSSDISSFSLLTAPQSDSTACKVNFNQVTQSKASDTAFYKQEPESFAYFGLCFSGFRGLKAKQ